MQRLLKTIVPFGLTLTIGIVAHQLLSRTNESVSWQCFEFGNLSTPISSISLPDVDFPEGVKRSKRFYSGSVRLRALFDEDGVVREAAPTPMLPYGVPESAAGQGEYRRFTAAMVHGKFVEELPFGLTNIAIEQLRQTKFSPAINEGRPVDERVMINVEFEYREKGFGCGCSDIIVTIMDSGGVRWRGNTWAHRDKGCVLR